MPGVIVPSARQKEDPLDTIMKGLNIANSIYGLKSNIDASKDKEEAKKNKDVYSKKEQVALSEKYDFVQPGTPGAQSVLFETAQGAKEAFIAPKQKVPEPKTRLIETVDAMGRPTQKTVEDRPGLEFPSYVKSSESGESAPKDYASKIKSLNASEKARFDHVRSYAKAVDQLETALVKGSDRYSLFGDNEFTAALDRAAESYGRMQSGGVISTSEEKKFKNMIRSLGDDESMTKAKLAEARAEADARFETLGFSSNEAPDIVMSRKSLADAYDKFKPGPGTAMAGTQDAVGEVKQNGWIYDRKTGQALRKAK